MKKIITGIIAILTILSLTGICFAEEGTNLSTDKPGKISEEAQAAADLSMAGKLAEYGRRVQNPLALVVAAQIMKNTPTQDKKLDKKSEGKGTADKGKKSGALETPEKLLADAKAMAQTQSNDLIAELIDKESKMTAQRGKVGGPIRHVDRIMAHAADTYTVRFRGGEYAEIAVIGDGDCDLDLYVYDENGNLIDSDTDRSDRCLVSFTPRWTGEFFIKIKNLDSVYADYILVSN